MASCSPSLIEIVTVRRFSGLVVERGLFPAQLGRWMRAAFDLRLRADYREPFQVTPDHAQETLTHARELLAAIRQELEGK